MSETLCRRCARPTSSFSHLTSHIPSGISLLEVLISMFVLLFGLMGVAAIFPVGSHYLVEGEKYDLGSSLAQNGFEELESRRMLRPEAWLYGSIPQATLDGTIRVINNDPTLPTYHNFNLPPTSPPGPGHAFVLDPFGVAELFGNNNIDVWPLELPDGDPQQVTPNINMPVEWTGGNSNLVGNRWPVRRITLPVPDPTGTNPFLPMNTAVAETIFRLRDDLAVDQPEEDDVPSMQRWATHDPNNTPDFAGDDIPLSRQYKGDYSWLATIVPTSQRSLLGLQPAHLNSTDAFFDVSVVVFRRRDLPPSDTTERMLQAQFEHGELLMYSKDNSAAGLQAFNDAFEDIRPGNWICVMGVNQTNGNFMLRWFRILSLDDESTTEPEEIEGNIETWPHRHAMLFNPDWPENSGEFLRAVIMPGTVTVTTRTMNF